MADSKHVQVLQKGVKAWNAWRKEHPRVQPDFCRHNFSLSNLVGVDLRYADLSHTEFDGAVLGHRPLPRFMSHGAGPANLSGADLTDANFPGADLSHVNLRDATMIRTNLRKAVLSGACLDGADLTDAFLDGADLRRASLRKSRLVKAQLVEADLREAILEGATLVEARLVDAQLQRANLALANLTGANLSRANLESSDLSRTLLVDSCFVDATLVGACIYGISAWSVDLTGAKQENLIVTPLEESTVTVDDLEVAQFIYLLLRREKLRNVIDALTAKAVLILGRFTPERRAILDALAIQVRQKNLLPIIFDFERSTARDFTETVKTLAGLSRFVIVDLTNPKSAPLELQATVPDYQIPFVPIIQRGEAPFSMFNDLRTKYPWMLKPVDYLSVETIPVIFEQHILNRAEQTYRALQASKSRSSDVLSFEDFLKPKNS